MELFRDTCRFSKVHSGFYHTSVCKPAASLSLPSNPQDGPTSGSNKKPLKCVEWDEGSVSGLGSFPLLLELWKLRSIPTLLGPKPEPWTLLMPTNWAPPPWRSEADGCDSETTRDHGGSCNATCQCFVSFFHPSIPLTSSLSASISLWKLQSS